MDFTGIADSAIGMITQAASGAGPGVIGAIGIVVGVGLIVSLVKKIR